MSLDIYLQDFSDAPADRSESVGRRVLAPLLDARGENLMTADGSAAVYGAGEAPLSGLMFNHIEGDLAWDAIFNIAVAGNWVIMPVGGPLCIVADDHAESVPENFANDGVIVVRSGSELRNAATAEA